MTTRPEAPRVAWASIVRHARVDSTQTVALSLAEQGAPDGTVVVADSQSAGRGRRGRTWHDEPGASLLVSIVVRPRLPSTRLPLLSLASGVVVAATLDRVAAVNARLKWPNDVLVGGRKIAGILLESRLAVERVVSVGIGINVLQRRFPEHLEGRATSLLRETGRTVALETLLETLLDEFGAWRRRLEHAGFAPVRAEWRRRADGFGQTVRVDGNDGHAVDLDDDGALLIRDGTGLHRVLAADVD
jgi:BirA family biotin operon repressor/biotin-[acetyl-CoA-carboxylase] ligase